MVGRIAIVGAGIAGLACGEALVRAGCTVRLFDKGRGPGGRASTRRVALDGGGEVAFDHGAQYMTAHDARFAHELERWSTLGLAAPWSAGEGWWVGTPGMSAPLAALAAGLDVAWRAEVGALRRDGDGWRLRIGDAWSERFDAVIAALPAEQTATLVEGHDDALGSLARAAPSGPCWTVMLAFDRRLPTERDVVQDCSDLPWSARNSAKPGRGATEAWVLQASPEWSRAHLEDEPDMVIAALIKLFARQLEFVLPLPVAAQAHRWRFARSARGGPGCWWNDTLHLGACGDWLIGPRFENAWLSGRVLADRIGG